MCASAEACYHTQGLPPATWLHHGITTLFSTSRCTLVLTFNPTSKMWGGMMWPSLKTTPKTITVAGNFVFITLGTSLLFVVIQRWFWQLRNWSWQKFFLSEKYQSKFGFLGCFSLLSNLADLINSLSSRSISGLSGACRTYISSPPSHRHSQLCVRRVNLRKYAELAAGEFHQWLPGPFRWTPLSGSSWRCPQPWASAPPPPNARPLSSALKHWTVRICILRVLAMVLLS